VKIFLMHDGVVDTFGRSVCREILRFVQRRFGQLNVPRDNRIGWHERTMPSSSRPLAPDRPKDFGKILGVVDVRLWRKLP
jgi:hypothetical protein